jgi:hypothetical protein
MQGRKEIYEALQAVNALLDDAGEQMLVDLVDKIRSAPAPVVEATLKSWIEFDAAEKAPEPQASPTWGPWGDEGRSGI